MSITDDNYLNALVELELLLLCFLFAWNFPKRRHFWVRAILFSLLFVALSFWTNSFDLGNSVLSGTLNYFLLFIFGNITLEICFEANLATIFFCTIAGYTVRHLIYLGWQMSFYLYQDYAANPIVGLSWVWVAISAGCTILFSPLIAYLYSLMKKMQNIALPSWKIIILAGLSLFINDILNMFVITVPLSGSAHVLEYIIGLFNILSSFMILLIMFGFVSESSLEKEVASINQMWHEEEKQYQFTKENVELINIKCHDLRKQIRALKTMHFTIPQEEIDSIEEATRFYDTKAMTGNPPLDAVLQEKSLVCAKNKIAFTHIIDGQALAFMAESDVFFLFSNIIDNAIESVMRIPDLEKRVITIKVNSVPGGVFAYAENPYLGELRYDDGLPISTKGDERYHGFGMKSIQLIVSRYGGTMQINPKNQVFALSLFFPENNTRKKA
jgi:hypothetical protein